MSGRNLTLLLRHIISSKNVATWKSIKDFRQCPANPSMSTGIFPFSSVSLVTNSIVMVEFPSAVDCKRSLKIIILKLLIALKIIMFANVLDLFFEAVAIFQNFSGINSVDRFLLRDLPKEDFKRKGLEQIRVLEIYNPAIGKAFLSHSIFQTFKED